MAIRPCLTSDSLRKPIVSSSVVSQNFFCASPKGSKNPNTGLHFFASAASSAEVSMDMLDLVATRVDTEAPLKAEGLKAAAEPAKREARTNFMVIDTRHEK